MQMKKVVEEAQKRIRKFCKKNGFNLNPDILDVPVEEVDEYLEKRGYSVSDNWEHISREEILRDLGFSEAYVLEVDEATSKPVIIYLLERMQELDFESQVQIIIHEYLHYPDILEIQKNIDEIEAEIEVLSYVISLYPEKIFEDGVDELSVRFNLPEKLEDEECRVFLELCRRKMYTLTREEVRRRLE